jgi:hypothetical protein
MAVKMKKAVVASFETLLQNLPVETEEGHGKLTCLSQYSNQGPHRYKINVRVFRTQDELLVVAVVLHRRTFGNELVYW